MALVAECRCGMRFAARPDLAGKQVFCPSCGQALVVPKPAPANAANLSIVAVCRCGHRLSAEPHLSGQAVNCPACGSLLNVPLVDNAAISHTNSPQMSCDDPSLYGWTPTPFAPAVPAPPTMPAWAVTSNQDEDKVNIGLLVAICGGALGVLILFFVVVGIINFASRPSVVDQAPVQPQAPVAVTEIAPHITDVHSNTTTPTESSSGPAWTNYVSESGQFLVEMPGTVKASQGMSSSGRSVFNSSCELNDGSVFTVAYTEVPQRLQSRDSNTILDNVAKAMADQSNGRIRTEIQIQINNHLGREIVVDGLDNDQTAAIHARLYLINARVYQVIWAQMEGSAPNSDSDRFLRSFELAP